jgi:hypothetical protein
MEFLQAAGSFLQQAVQAVQAVPEMAPLMGEMLMFGVRAFKASRPIEAAFEQAVQKLNLPQQPKPDPEAAKAQGEAAKAQAKGQADIEIARIKAEASIAVDRAKAEAQQQTDIVRQQAEREQHAAKLDNEAQLKLMEARMSQQIESMKLDFEQWKVMKQAETAITVAEVNSAATLTPDQDNAADEASRD